MRKYLLVAAQGFNLLLPFVMLPILNSRLGPDVFGSYAFWISTATFITILTDWGFNVYGVSQVSRRRSNYFRAFRFLFEVSCFKFVVAVLVVSLGSVAIYLYSGAQNATHFLSASSVIFGGIFFPIWFYNGINKVGFALVAILPLRGLQLLFTLDFVTAPDDLNFSLALAGGAQILSFGLLLAIAAGNGLNLKFLIMSCRLKSVTHHVTASVGLFASSILSSSVISLSSVVLSFFVPKSVVGSFYIADRGLRALLSLYASFSSGVLADRSENFGDGSGNNHLTRRLIFALALSALILILFFAVGELFLNLFVGVSASAVEGIIDIYIFIIPIVFVSNVFGVQVLLAARCGDAFVVNISAGVVVYWLLVFPVGFNFGLLGYLWLLLGSEMIILALMYRSCRVRGLV